MAKTVQNSPQLSLFDATESELKTPEMVFKAALMDVIREKLLNPVETKGKLSLEAIRHILNASRNIIGKFQGGKPGVPYKDQHPWEASKDERDD